MGGWVVGVVVAELFKINAYDCWPKTQIIRMIGYLNNILCILCMPFSKEFYYLLMIITTYVTFISYIITLKSSGYNQDMNLISLKVAYDCMILCA